MNDSLTVFDRDWIVSWSRELILNTDKEMWAYRLLLLYMARIDPRVPEQSKVYFTKKELERFFDRDEIKDETVQHAFEELMSVFQLQGSDGQWIFINLFDIAGKTILNGEDAYCLMASASGMKYFFFFFSVGYALSRLGTLIDAKSSYTLSLYKYFLIQLMNRKSHEWEVTFDDMKQELRYFGTSENRYFVKNVIKKACAEINDISDLHVEYETVIKHRKLEKIRFKIKRRSDKYLEEKAKKIKQEIINNATMDLIAKICNVFNNDKNPSRISEKDALNIIKASDECNKKTDELWEILAYVAAQNNINNIVGYTISLIKNGYSAPKSIKKEKLGTTAFAAAPTKESQEWLKEIERLHLAQVESSTEKDDSDDEHK